MYCCFVSQQKQHCLYGTSRKAFKQACDLFILLSVTHGNENTQADVNQKFYLPTWHFTCPKNLPSCKFCSGSIKLRCLFGDKKRTYLLQLRKATEEVKKKKKKGCGFMMWGGIYGGNPQWSTAVPSCVVGPIWENCCELARKQASNKQQHEARGPPSCRMVYTGSSGSIKRVLQLNAQ